VTSAKEVVVMVNSRITVEIVIAFLKQAEAVVSVAELCRQNAVNPMCVLHVNQP
jgi:hypothetical protein